MTGALGNSDRLLAGNYRQGGNTGLLTQYAQLLLCCRPCHIKRRHQHFFALLFGQELGQLRRRRRLARPLETNHHDDGGEGNINIKPGGFAAQQFHQRVVDNLDDLLARRDRTCDFAADSAGGDIFHELLDDWQRNISLEQRDAHLAHGSAHIEFRQSAAPPEFLEYAA